MVVRRDELSVARHALRGHVNALKLCLAVVESETEPLECVTWLENIATEADRAAAAIDRFESAREAAEPSAGAPAPVAESTAADGAAV